jgi:hypothetical protein
VVWIDLKLEGGFAPLNIAGGWNSPGMRTISFERHFGHCKFFISPLPVGLVCKRN